MNQYDNMTGSQYITDCGQTMTRTTTTTSSSSSTTTTTCHKRNKHDDDQMVSEVPGDAGGFYFLVTPGGTGKTFLISLLLATIRSQNKIALASASSGIAATLLDGSRTAHSALKFPLNYQVNETPTCNSSKTSGSAKLLKRCGIIICDGCTRANKKSLEALERTMKDIRVNSGLFGGALILLSGVGSDKHYPSFLERQLPMKLTLA